MYNSLSKEIENQILLNQSKNAFSKFAFCDDLAVREKDNPHDYPSAVRSNFIKDTDKIINCPFFSRYQDKTQVFSLYKNDDITRRSLHVQFVSRISRTIGKALGLNLELIEAIALGHDIGHTPFGHAGEYILDELFYSKTKRHFYHNLHSVRVLKDIFPLNLSLQTLDGILCHNGEMELSTYYPNKLKNFKEFNEITENCYVKKGFMESIVPSTLEGCVVRISDIIAYLGKDRQDAERTKIASQNDFICSEVGFFNAEMINNITINIIENSFDKPYIKMDKKFFDELSVAKSENYKLIYNNEKLKEKIANNLKPMMQKLYDKLYEDLISKNTSSYIFKHHINHVLKNHYVKDNSYLLTEPNQIVVDYIASMTDDYFIDLYNKLFPKDERALKYTGYFD